MLFAAVGEDHEELKGTERYDEVKAALKVTVYALSMA